MNRYLWISIECGCLQVGQPDVILTNISVHETITICRLEDNILNIYCLVIHLHVAHVNSASCDPALFASMLSELYSSFLSIGDWNQGLN